MSASSEQVSESQGYVDVLLKGNGTLHVLECFGSGGKRHSSKNRHCTNMSSTGANSIEIQWAPFPYNVYFIHKLYSYYRYHHNWCIAADRTDLKIECVSKSEFVSFFGNFTSFVVGGKKRGCGVFLHDEADGGSVWEWVWLMVSVVLSGCGWGWPWRIVGVVENGRG